MRLALLAGLQAGGLRDLYKVFGWTRRLEHQHFLAKYQRQDICRRVVDAPVSAVWADPPAVTGDDTFQKAWDDLNAKMPVWHELRRVDTLAGLGRFAVLVIGMDDGGKLDTPAPTKQGTQVIYLQPYGEGSARISAYEENQASARFGLPLMYQITPGGFEMSGSASQSNVTNSKTFTVHYSRVLHIADNTLESKVYGSSRLECVFNILDDILKVVGGSAEMFWLAANRGLHVDVDKDMELEPTDQAALADEVQEYEDQLRRIIRTRGVKVKSLGSDVADPTGVFDVLMSLLAATTGIPKRVLMGAEAGQLASQQDRANWADRIDERITGYAQPIMLIPFIRLLIDSGVLPAPSQMSITWPDAFKMNPFERAQTSAQMARSATNLAGMLQKVEQINQMIAEANRPSFVPISGGGFGANGGLSVNSTDSSSSSSTGSNTTDPNATTEPAEGYGTATADPTTAPPNMIERPPLIPGRSMIQLLTPEECRSIIGFGKHMPVFDSKSDAKIAGSVKSIAGGSSEVTI